MQNLLRLLQELKVPAIEPVIMVEPIDKDSVEEQELSYQLQLNLDTHE
jgi:hypothetical protein